MNANSLIKGQKRHWIGPAHTVNFDPVVLYLSGVCAGTYQSGDTIFSGWGRVYFGLQ
jgi:hypothetical protein